MIRIKAKERALDNVAYIFQRESGAWGCQLRNGTPADVSYAGLEHGRHGEFMLEADGLGVAAVLGLIEHKYARRYKSGPLDGQTTHEYTVEGETVRSSDNEPQRACPKCGDERHLYRAGADVRWRPEERKWEHTGDYDLIECTSCDWTGTEEDTEVKTDG